MSWHVHELPNNGMQRTGFACRRCLAIPTAPQCDTWSKVGLATGVSALALVGGGFWLACQGTWGAVFCFGAAWPFSFVLALFAMVTCLLGLRSRPRRFASLGLVSSLIALLPTGYHIGLIVYPFLRLPAT